MGTINSLTVKEDFNSFEGEQSEDSGSFERVFFAESEDLNYAQAPLDALEYAKNNDLIPPYGDKITAGGQSYYLRSYDHERGVDSTEAVVLTCNYEAKGETSEDEPDEDLADNKEAEEKRRKQTYKAPFNERLEYQNETTEVLTGLDPTTDEKKPLPRKIQIMKGTVLWKFDVITYPDDNYYLQIGNINDDIYPAIDSVYRPFRFNEKNLLYIGSTAEEWNTPVNDNPNGDLAAENIPSSWMWKHTFSFAFRHEDWDLEKFYLTKKEHPIKFETGKQLYYYNYNSTDYEPLTDSNGDPVTSTDAIAEMPLLHRESTTTSPGGSYNYTHPYEAIIEEREPKHFDTGFGFYWGPLGNESGVTTT